MDVETLELEEIMGRAMERGIKNGNFEHPESLKELEEFMIRKTPVDANRAKKVSFATPRPLKKKKKPKSVNKALGDSSSSEDENVGTFPFGQNKQRYQSNIIKTPKAWVPEVPDDTPFFPQHVSEEEEVVVYDTVEEEAVLLRFESLCLEEKERVFEKKRVEVLEEIVASLRSMPDLQNQIERPGWRSLFIYSNSNESEYVTDEDIKKILQDFYKQ